jgi:hypothetical protein
MEQEFNSVKEFYPYYLTQHTKRGTRLCHVIGITLAMFCFGAFLASWKIGLILIGVTLGYGFSWCGHFFSEKNRPATLEHPVYSLICDFKMFNDILDGGLEFDAPKDHTVKSN